MLNETVATPDPGKENNGIGAFCGYCGSARLRRSRLRAEDALAIAELRWPVRCLQCNHRQLISWLKAWRAVSAKAPHVKANSTEQSWGSYTSSAAPVLRDDGQGPHGA